MIMDIETIIETNTSMRTQELLPPPNTSLASPASSAWPGLDITNTSLSWAWLGLDSLDWSQVLVWDHECPHWQPLHHLYYQASDPHNLYQSDLYIITAGSPLLVTGLAPPPGLSPDLAAVEARPGNSQLAADSLGSDDPGLLSGLADLVPDAAGGQHNSPAPLRARPSLPPLRLHAA